MFDFINNDFISNTKPEVIISSFQIWSLQNGAMFGKVVRALQQSSSVCTLHSLQRYLPWVASRASVYEDHRPSKRNPAWVYSLRMHTLLREAKSAIGHFWHLRQHGGALLNWGLQTSCEPVTKALSVPLLSFEGFLRASYFKLTTVHLSVRLGFPVPGSLYISISTESIWESLSLELGD